MEINEYQFEAMKTDPLYRGGFSRKFDSERLLEGLMGLNGEAGEAIDILKKHMFQGHALDVEHMALELGDVAWYLALCADALGYELEDILKMNIDKLRKRYPDAHFDKERSINRREDDI